MDLSLGLDAVFRKTDTYTDYFINVRLVANFSYHISRYNSLALQLQYAISLPRYYLTESLQDRPDYTYRYDTTVLQTVAISFCWASAINSNIKRLIVRQLNSKTQIKDLV